MNSESSIAGFKWGVLLLVLLMGIYVAVLTQIVAPTETGVRVIPWQAPDLEIPSPAAEVLPPESLP